MKMRVARPRRLVAGLLTFMIVATGLFAIWLTYIGAFGGQLYFDLPAQKVRDQPRSDVAIVLLSGDMGFRIGMGPQVAERLAAKGYAVTGVSSLVHFRKARTPAKITRFVADAMAHATAVTGARRLILIGQSYGADMLHVGLTTLSPALRQKVALAALVVPTDTVYYDISPGETFEWDAPDAMAIDTARRLDWVPALCIQGRDETNSLCPLLRQPNVERVALPGGHPLHRDAGAVADVLAGKIRTVLGPTS
ncbi:AcvB/VirJ family lysyl-phosphatidylglycerol hydrolase [Sphingobium sp.]|uniref:AcvB/VirJ family lysyl-phosphatidylglycerol hydrolase n=1 Tax=Sphingobium sp. TaxID=1912891 RepID=UPI003BB675D8